MARDPGRRRERARSHRGGKAHAARTGRRGHTQERGGERQGPARAHRHAHCIDRPAGAARDPGRAMKILYVEDNDDNIYVLRNRLTRAGYTVLVAMNGEEGVAMAAIEKPDLIL